MEKKNLIEIGLCVDNLWLDKYCELINTNKGRIYETSRTQAHHITPKYYYEDNNIAIDNSANNLVNLLYKDHIRAHYYLMLCASNVKYKTDNLLAMRRIFGDKFTEDTDIEYFDLDLYQENYELCRDYLYEILHKFDACEKISKKLSGRVSPAKGKTWKKPKKSKKNPNAKNKLLSDYASARVGEKNSFYGHTHSAATRQVLRNLKSMPVNMLDYSTKEIIKTFTSAKDAGLYLVENKITTNTSSGSRILTVCREGDLKYHAYGYSWQFANKV